MKDTPLLLVVDDRFKFSKKLNDVFDIRSVMTESKNAKRLIAKFRHRIKNRKKLNDRLTEEWFYVKKLVRGAARSMQVHRVVNHPGGYICIAAMRKQLYTSRQAPTITIYMMQRTTRYAHTNGVSTMSRKSKKSQSIAVEAPVIVTDVEAPAEFVAMVATEAAADVLDAGGTLEQAADAFDAVSPPEVAPAEIATQKVATRKYPREGGKCWQVWNACDELRATGKYVTVKDARDIATVNGWNLSNASQEFYAWKKFREIA